MPDSVPELLSLVIPVFNERESLKRLLAEITEVARGLNLETEVIFVDDGSRDGSWDVIRELVVDNGGVHGIRFRRNFGKAAALQAGFQSARGGIVMTLDADLQDDPREIPKFIEKIHAGCDVVSGWKKIRHDPWHKVLPSRVFNKLVGVVTGLRLHDHNCGMKAYRAEALREVNLYGELHRFIPVLASARGFRVSEVVINHRARKFGVSKYRWPRFIKGFLDLGTVHFLTQFGRRPQHLLGGYGLTTGCLGLVCMTAFCVLLWVGVYWREPSVTATAILGLSGAIVLLLLMGQFLMAGLLAELVAARKMMEQDAFSIVERTHSETDAP